LNWKEVKHVQEPINITKSPSAMKVLSFDIECTSSHGDFPQAKKDYKKVAKDLLEILDESLTADRIAETLRHIGKQDYGGVHRVFPKRPKTWDSKVETALSGYNRDLANQLFRSLRIHLLACECRKEGTLSYNLETLASVLGYSDYDKMPPLQSLNQYCSFIPSMKIIRKQSFCGLDEALDDSETGATLCEVSYTEKRDPSSYTEAYLTELCDQYLPQLEGDAVIQICGCFLRHGESESYRKVILTLGSCDNFDEDTEVIPKKSERKLLLKWMELIKSEDPDVITGYNIFDFDWPYLFDRSEELGIYDDFSQISRLRDYQCQVKETNSKGIKGKFVEIPGRIEVDLFKVVQRDHNLQSYKLDNVSATFIRGKVKSIVPEVDSDNTRVETDNTIGLRIGNFVQFIQEKGYDEEKIMDGKKFPIVRLEKNSIVVAGHVPCAEDAKCVWCLGKDDVSPADIFRLQKTDSKGRAIVAKYCVMDTILCLELMNKLQILNNNIGMANVCSTPLSWIFKRGQGIKILSLVSKECRKKNYLIPTLYPDSYGDDSYEGAIVLKPYPGIYFGLCFALPQFYAFEKLISRNPGRRSEVAW
jgi:hypothetical protein